MTIYRATDGYLGTGSWWASDRADAEAYRDNPGFGGPNLYRLDLPSDVYVCDLTCGALSAHDADDGDMIEELADVLRRHGHNDLADDVLDDLACGVDYAHQHIDRAAVREALVQHYDAVLLADSYPEACMSYCLLEDFSEAAVLAE
jgi:hypothetical protein